MTRMRASVIKPMFCGSDWREQEGRRASGSGMQFVMPLDGEQM